MEWLSQNWIWLAFAVGAFLLMTRGHHGGHGGCCGGIGHRANDKHPETAVPQANDAPGNGRGE